MIETLEKNIEEIKNILNTLPVNNEKNLQKYLEFANACYAKYDNLLKESYAEIQKRYEAIIKVETNPEIESLKLKVAEFEDLPFLNRFEKPFEMMGLDKYLYKMSYFYKNDLEKVNKDIRSALEILKNAGAENIELNYCPHVKEYIDAVLNEDEEIYSVFENIYWKCPDIITHIELNLKSFYMKKAKDFEKHYEKLRQKYLNGRSMQAITKEYDENRLKLEKLLLGDKKIILDKFLDGTYQIKDYSEANIQKIYAKLQKDDTPIEIVNVKKLYHRLIEYKCYLKYSFIIDDIRKKYSEKEKYKDVFENKCKEIAKEEANLMKLNKEHEKALNGNMFSKPDPVKANSLTLTISNLIHELEKKYEDLAQSAILQKICQLGPQTPLRDILELATSNIVYMASMMPDKGMEEVEEEVRNLKKFLLDPNMLMLNNISFTDERNMEYVICDRYALINIKVEMEDLQDESTIDSLRDDCFKLIFSEMIKEAGLTVEDIEFVIKAKKLIENG